MNGPGELTLTSIVLFTLGAYGVAAGAASGEQSVVAVGVFAFALFVLGIIWPIVVLSRRRHRGVGARPTRPSARATTCTSGCTGASPRVEVRLLDPPGEWWVTAAPADGVIPHVAARRGVFRSCAFELRTSAPLGVFVRVAGRSASSCPIEIAVAPAP